MLWPMILALTNGSGPKDLDVAKTEKIAMAAQNCTILIEYESFISKVQIAHYCQKSSADIRLILLHNTSASRKFFALSKPSHG